MAWLGNLASSVFRNLMADIPAGQVVEVKSTSEFHKRHIYCREDSLVLYKPGNTEREKKYEIILHRPCTETLHQGFRYLDSLLTVMHKINL